MLQPPAPAALTVREEELPEPTVLKSKWATEPSGLFYGNYVSLSYGKLLSVALDHFLLRISKGRKRI
jgi:hypothetical protein